MASAMLGRSQAAPGGASAAAWPLPCSARPPSRCSSRRCRRNRVAPARRTRPVLGETVARRLPSEIGVEIVEGAEAHGVARALGGAADMRHEEDVVELHILWIELGLVLVDIEPGGA